MVRNDQLCITSNPPSSSSVFIFKQPSALRALPFLGGHRQALLFRLASLHLFFMTLRFIETFWEGLKTIQRPLVRDGLRKDREKVIKKGTSADLEKGGTYCPTFLSISFLTYLLSESFEGYLRFLFPSSLATPIKSVIPSAISMENDFFCRTNPLCVNNLLAPSSLQALCWKKYPT